MQDQFLIVKKKGRIGKIFLFFLFTSFFGYVKFLDENLQNLYIMNAIIQNLLGFVKREDRPLLTIQEQLELVRQKSCFRVKRAMRRQMFHSEVICKMFAMTEGERGGKVERMLAYYLQKYGFNDEIRLFLLKSKAPENTAAADYRQKVIDAYGIRLNRETETLSATCEEVLEALENKDFNIRTFLLKSKSLSETLKVIRDTKEKMRTAAWAFVKPYPTISGDDGVFDNMPYVSEPTLSDGECRAAISDSFPTLAEQKSVLVSENGLWIETLTFLCEKTAEVWNAYLGKFDESLLLPELKKNV